MRVHHLNCISTCPLGGHLMDGDCESILQRGHLTNHCLLVEGDSELILIDTGFGLRDVSAPHTRLSNFFLGMLSPDFREELTAFRQIQRLGFNPQDVRHIILTHLDFDHAGGLDDFPWAKVHMLQAERDSAQLQKTWLDRQRYRPQQWNYKDKWQGYSIKGGEAWFGFDRVHGLEGISEDIALIPLIGHTFGHAGIAVRKDNQWLFNTGDAYFYHEEMNIHKPCCTPGLTFYQNMMDKDHKQRVWNQERLRELKRDYPQDVKVFCSHDVREFELIAGRSPELPVKEVASFKDDPTWGIASGANRDKSGAFH